MIRVRVRGYNADVALTCTECPGWVRLWSSMFGVPIAPLIDAAMDHARTHGVDEIRTDSGPIRPENEPDRPENRGSIIERGR